MVDPTLEGLEPVLLWKHFDELMKIPRCSKHEEQVARYVIGVAERLGLEHRQDAAGNVLVLKGGTAGREGAPAVVLQGHLDMVCEKNADVTHDFSTDPIRPDLRGDLLYAQGTTLGADNGIGVATALALLESTDVAHGPLETLCTVDEETGLTGAFEIQPGFLKGRVMLNLDSEDMGVVTIGCAGGGDSHLALPLEMSDLGPGRVLVTVRVDGLRGGHSGVDVHEERANAVKLLTRVLWDAQDLNYSLVDIKGGDKHNAIPREAWVTVALSPDDAFSLRGIAQKAQADFEAEYGTREPKLRISVEQGGPAAGEGASIGSSFNAVRMLMALPHGVEKFSHDMEGLVETSTNLAAVYIKDGELWALHSTRSSIASALEALRGRIEAIANLAGASIEHKMSYPGWKPNPSSRLLGVAKAVHVEIFGSEPVVEAIHAGLETGIIGERFEGMDMISIGPTIKNPHSPDEYVDTSTVVGYWRWVEALLDRLSA